MCNCYHEFVEWFCRALSEMFDLARENLQKSAVREKRHYDARVNSKSFEIGNLVWFYWPVKAKKLSSPWVGPFEIVKSLKPAVYEIKSQSSGKLRRTHVDNLRPYVADDVQLPEVSLVDPLVIEPCDDLEPVDEPRTSKRIVKRPAYLEDFVTSLC